MILEKVEKALDLLIRIMEKELGQEEAPLNYAPVAELKTKKEKKPKAPKPEPIGEPVQPAQVVDPLADFGPQSELKPSPEQIIEASKAFLEVCGAFIRTHLRDNGQAKAKAIIEEVLGRKLDVKLDQLPYADHVNLLARFEKELDK